MMMMKGSLVVVVVVVALSLFSSSPRQSFVVSSADDDWNLEEEMSDWVDPHSMIEGNKKKKAAGRGQEEQVSDGSCEKSDADLAIVERKVTDCNRKVEALKKNLDEQKELYRKAETVAVKEQPFFRQYLQQLLSIFKNCETNTRQGRYKVDVVISSDSYGHLSNYVKHENVSVQEVHSILSKMMTDIRWVIEEPQMNDELGSVPFFSSDIIHCLHIILLGLVIMISTFHAVSLMRRINVSPSRFLFLMFFFLIVASFVISIPWTWWHLYKKEVAKRIARRAQGSVDCTSRLTSFWSTVASFFVVQSDQCQKYIEDMEIDPLWEVPPTQAIAVTLTRFFLEPAGYIGRAIREFTMSAFEGLPISLWIPVFVLIVLLLVLSLCCLGGYRVYTPLFRIEPSRDGGAAVEMARLQQQNLNLQGQIRELTGRANLDGGGDQLRSGGVVPAIQGNPRQPVDAVNSKEDTQRKEKIVAKVVKSKFPLSDSKEPASDPEKTNAAKSETKSSGSRGDHCEPPEDWVELSKNGNVEENHGLQSAKI